MKKTIILFIFTLIVIQVFPESIDSLKAKREKLYKKYTDINIPGKETTKANNEKSISILKDLIIVDTRIISEFSAFDKKTKEYDLKIESLNKENKSLSDKLIANTDQLFIIYIAGGAIVFILTLTFTFLFIYFVKFSKAKKKTLNYAEMLKQTDNDRLALQQANETIKLKDKDLTEKKSLINTLLKEKELIDKKLVEIQKQTLISSEQNPQLEKVNINMAKIEKLVKMKEQGIVTEEEFNTFKQKFMNEL